MAKAEFTVTGSYAYNRSGPARWIISHVWRYPHLVAGTLVTTVLANWMSARVQLGIGAAFDHVVSPEGNLRALLLIALGVLGFGLGSAGSSLLGNVANEFLAQRLERDARDELYLSLLGKSLSFHGRQRLGDVMARATNDVRQLNLMFSPGLRLIFSSGMSLVIPIVTIAGINTRLLLVPLLFVPVLGLTIWHYNRRLEPVAEAQQVQYGAISAGLEEVISGIEVVKANAQEPRERERFTADASRYRDLSVRQGEIQARYLPLLAYYVMLAVAFTHALLLYGRGLVTLGDIIAFMGLLGLLQFPTFISIFTFSLVQLGLAGAERILELIEARTELDENKAGVSGEISGEVVFEDVSFSYDGAEVLHGISFHARPGETVAIVGQTGSGKTTLTRLINRIYDVSQGRVLVDGTDVRDWSIESLRSQISTIEQDVFLFSRSIAENIAFGAGADLSREDIERFAREAQAHDFIMALPQGYDTVVGERGVTLSGGQRQRIAIARAFATNPRILILDDSTSAIDSATEDQIQLAMSRVSRGRTTFLITHRLSQIRWADRILVLRQGRLEDQGTHEDLLQRSLAYRNIFARYEGSPPSAPPQRARSASSPSPQGSGEAA
ncbi:MAG: ABC transporter ATP-binding protein [Anaerolineae bacterium]|nr:ABC transporter ATP-binding protein [Anaerolineae bacterium]